MSSPTRAVTEFVGLYAVISTSFTCQGDSHTVPVMVSPFVNFLSRTIPKMFPSVFWCSDVVGRLKPFCDLLACCQGVQVHVPRACSQVISQQADCYGNALVGEFMVAFLLVFNVLRTAVNSDFVFW